jgi:ArsR family transcriptional regulator, zinc-responsive transcriptional repressor
MATAQKLLIRSITPDHLNRAAEVIRLLGHAERLKILEVLERGEASVTDIQAALDLPQAIVSQHLAKMRGLNVVASRRDGQHVYYHIIEPKVQHVLRCIRTCDL